MTRWWWLGGVGASIAIAVACSSSSTNGPNGGGPGGSGGATDGGDPNTGQALVTQYYQCTKCHGPDMAGSTQPLQLQQPVPCTELYPPNLTPDPTTGVGTWSDAQLANAIVNGVDNLSESLCPEMKHYKDAAPADVTDIIAYLRSIPAVKKVIPGSICPPLKGECDGGV
jgi:mono/diheme cytochrome c family protein